MSVQATSELLSERRVVEVTSVEQPGTVAQRMRGGHGPPLGFEPEGLQGDARVSCRCGQVHPSLGLLPLGAVDRNPAIGAHGGHSHAAPAVTSAGQDAIAVEVGGNERVVADSSQVAHDIDHVRAGV